MQNKKTIKSFRQLSELNRRAILDKNGNIKKIDNKFIVSVARQLADGFDNIDLRKKPSKSQARRARNIVKEFYQATRNEKIKIIRPSKKNRKIYAEYADMPKAFKIYAIPAYNAGDSFKIIGKGKNRRIKRKGRFSNTEFFKFESRKELVKNPKKETKKLYAKIDKKFKKPYAVKIKCGKYEYKTLYEKRDPHVEIQNWLEQYGKERVSKFCMGFQVYTFTNQKTPTKEIRLKGDKKFKNCKKCTTKIKCRNAKKCRLKSK